MNELAQILNAVAWPSVVLIVLAAFYCPLKRVLERVLQVRAGSKGIELVLDELNKEGKLPFGSRKELSGLSAHDIWALDTFANAPPPILVSRLKVPQRVAARTLSEASLFTVEGDGENRKVIVTSLGRDILSAAGKLL